MPRQPRCYAHSVWMAACDDCRAQHSAEQSAALARLAVAANAARRAP